MLIERFCAVHSRGVGGWYDYDEEPRMNFTINALLTAKSCAKGVSAEEYAHQVLERDLAQEWRQK